MDIDDNNLNLPVNSHFELTLYPMTLTRMVTFMRMDSLADGLSCLNCR